MTESANTRFIYHELPPPDYLQAVGEVSIRHGQLDHMLRMAIKTLAGVSAKEAMEATEMVPSATLRERVRKLARMHMGEGTALVKLDALLERCRQATRWRNELVHAIVGRELDSDLVMRREDHSWAPLPPIEDLQSLSVQLSALTLELNTARRGGFISEALIAKGRTGT